jgi:hypothetical protein
MVDDDEGEQGDCPYSCDTLTADFVDDAIPIYVPKGQILTFVSEMRVQFLREEISVPELTAEEIVGDHAIEESIRSKVDGLVRKFFCNDEYTCKCRETDASTEKQIELWNFLARNTPERPYDDIISKIISIISIPASEASCERSFSRQKRIMEHSRVRSHSNLLQARFLLKGRGKE